MDLLEYMRSQNVMGRAQWERTFEEEDREILVLLAGGRGASKRNGFWDVAHYFLAYVDCQAGALYEDEGRLVFAVSDEESEAGGVLDRFRQEAIYRVRARKKVPQEVPEGVSAPSQNQFLLVEVLEENPTCFALEEVLERYLTPIVVNDDVLGELTLNKDYGMFEGELLWQGERVEVSLEVDPACEGSWTAARQAMKAMLADQGRWDRDMRDSAARELTQLACEWRESADDDVPAITEESFAQRLDLTSIAMDPDGSFSAYFEDDDMFFGHCVVVYGTLADGVTSAVMAG